MTRPRLRTIDELLRNVFSALGLLLVVTGGYAVVMMVIR
jgi:hypothetical protein